MNLQKAGKRKLIHQERASMDGDLFNLLDRFEPAWDGRFS
jgi:hypothetical protein